MSKKLIAGAGVVASMAVALAPLATFAATNTPNAQRDILNVTIEEVCAFGYGNIAAGSHTNGTTTGYTGEHTTARPADTEAVPPVAAAGAGNGLWNTATVVGYDATLQSPTPDTDTAYGIMEANTVNPDFAKTTLNVVCNDADGYTITAETTDLNASGVANGIASVAAQPAAGTSSWAFQIADTSTGTTNSAEIKTSAGSDGWYGGYSTATEIIGAKSSGTDKSTPDTGDIWTMTYGIGISKAQAAATYEGHVDYILASIDV